MLSIGGTSPEAMEKHTQNWGRTGAGAAQWTCAGSQQVAAGDLIHVAETREKARENVRFGIDAFRDYFSDVGTFPIVPPDIKDPYTFFVESGAGCIGTPDDAIAYMEDLLKGSGGFGAIMELAHNWADWEATKRHYELMARFVHPHFQRSRELRRDSYAYARDRHEEFTGQSAAAVQAAIDSLAARRAAE